MKTFIEIHSVRRATMRMPYELLMVSALALAGCGPVDDGPPRRGVQGTVSYAEKPIEYGHIRFVPQPTGPLTVAIITDGKYQLSESHGVPLGSHRVEIQSLVKPSGASGDELNVQSSSAGFVAIPEKYHSQSELTAEIPSGTGTWTLDFHLEK